MCTSDHEIEHNIFFNISSICYNQLIVLFHKLKGCLSYRSNRRKSWLKSYFLYKTLLDEIIFLIQNFVR